MATDENKRNPLEVWMRGPVEGVPVPLQPVAHALLQAAEEIECMMSGFPDDLLWERPAGVASPGFHLQHIPGVIDRLFTYADGQQLGNAQLKYLSEEGLENTTITTLGLVQYAVNGIVDAVAKLKSIDPATL